MADLRTNLQLLNREVTVESLREITRHVASPKVVVERGKNSIVIFRLGKEWFGLQTDLLHEITDDCVIHTLPHRRNGILAGLVNVRGELLLCIAVEVLLGLERIVRPVRPTEKTKPLLLVCGSGNEHFAFRADEVFGICRYNAEDLKAIPATLAKSETGVFTAGILPWRDRTIGCLNSELLLYAIDKGLR